MPGNGFVGALHIVVGRSPRLCAGLVAAHVLALALLGLTLPGGLRGSALLLAVVVSGGIATYRTWRRRGDAIVALLLDSADAWQVTLADGRVLGAYLLPRPVVHAHAIVLRLRCADDRVRTVALLADNSAAAPRRRLRVRLMYPRGADGLDAAPNAASGPGARPSPRRAV